MIIINVKQGSDEWLDERRGSITGTRPKKLFVERLASKEKMVESILTANPEEDQKALKKMSSSDLEAMLTESDYDKLFYRAQKKEYWRLLGEMAGYVAEELVDDYGRPEDPRQRGHRLEDQAASFLEINIGIQTCKVGICALEGFDEIRISPDRLITNDKVILDEEGNIDESIDPNTLTFVGGVEIKSPEIANHLETIFCNWVPDEYWLQVLQYFVVTDADYVYYVSHCPEVTDRPLYFLKIERKDHLEEINESLFRQVELVKHLKKDAAALTF